MHSFFSRHKRTIFGSVMVFVVISMMFYGVGNKSMARPKSVPDVVYKVGKIGEEVSVSKRRLEAMKTYLSYDLGYGYNDALERQNIFADGFFVDLINSSFGDQVIDEYYAVIEKDFANKMKGHKQSRVYKHPSGKLNLEDEWKIYASNLYEGYQDVRSSDREVDASLFKDMVALSGKQRYFRPKDSKLLSSIFMRDRKLGPDPSFERRNFALFGAKSNEDLFGTGFVELVAQFVLAFEDYAISHGYKTSYEEANGVLNRRALDFIGETFKQVVDKEEVLKIKDRFLANMHIPERDLMDAGKAIITVQKMIKDLDSTLLMDTKSVVSLYKNRVDTLLVKMVQDSGKRDVKSAEDALELHYYLSALGKNKKFLDVPESVYGPEELKISAKELFVKDYQLKLAAVTREEVAKQIALKEVWDYQVTDKGWNEIAKEFSFKDASDRFGFLQSLGKKESAKVENFVRLKMVDGSSKRISLALSAKEFRKGDFLYHEAVASGPFDDAFHEKSFVKLLDNMKEGEEVPCYTQDDKTFYRVLLWKRAEEKRIPTLSEAKNKGYLKYIVDKKLKALNKGKRVAEEAREALLVKLLKKEAGDKTAAVLLLAEKNEKAFTLHQERRLEGWRKGEFEPSKDPLLSQFNIYEKKEIVSRVGKNKEIAKEAFFKMDEGEISSINYLDRGVPYYVHVLGHKIDEEKLGKYISAVGENLSGDLRTMLYKELFSYVQDKKLLVMSRFAEGEE